MTPHFIKPGTRKYVKGEKSILQRYGKKFLDTATKAGLEALKTISKKVVQKTTDNVW